MQYIFLLFLLCLTPKFLFSQQTALIEEIVSSLKKADNLTYDNKDSALYFAQKALDIAQKLDSPRLMFKAYRAMGYVYEEHKDLQKAEEIYNIGKELADNRCALKEQFAAYTDWAILHKRMGQYAVAQEYHQLVVDKGEKAGNWEMVEMGYHGLGTMYSMMSDFDKSIQVYHKSIEAAQKWNNIKGVISTEQNISNIYLKAKNHDMALKNIEKTYLMALKLGDSMRIGTALTIYGSVYIAKGDYPKALEKQLQAKEIFEKCRDKVRVSDAYLSLAGIYLTLKDYPKAHYYLDTCAQFLPFLTNYFTANFYQQQGNLYRAEGKTAAAIAAFAHSLVLTDSFIFKEIAQVNHATLAHIFAEQKQFDKTYLHSLASEKLNAELFEERNQKNMTEAQFKFDVEKRDTEIATQKKALNQATQMGFVLVIGVILLGGLLFYTYKQVLEKKKAHQRIEMVMRELHHRVKNNMQTIASMMRVQARQQSDPSVSAILLENKTRLETYSMLHQQLYQNDQIETMNLKPYLQGIIAKMRMLYNMGGEEKLQIQLNTTVDKLGVDAALTVGLIFNELITNSLKHATPSVLRLKITIQLDKNHFHYADNGESLPDNFDFDNQEGFGLQLIQYFSEQLKAKYAFSVKDGFQFDLYF